MLKTMNKDKSIRLFAILQLCFVFTAIASKGSDPFMGELFSFKSKALLYHYVMGDSTLMHASHNDEGKKKLERNQERFKKLPEEMQKQFQNQLNELMQMTEKSFSHKLKEAVEILTMKLPVFERAWIFFSIIIAILLLLRNESARNAVWVLPIVLLLYAWDNQMNGSKGFISPDTKIFPSEEVIVNDYLREPLSKEILEQHAQLLRGWKIYLIKEWGLQEPSRDPFLFEVQAEEGEYAFNIARLEALGQEKTPFKTFKEKESLFLIILYFLWNLWFAYRVGFERLKSLGILSFNKNNVL